MQPSPPIAAATAAARADAAAAAATAESLPPPLLVLFPTPGVELSALIPSVLTQVGSLSNSVCEDDGAGTGAAGPACGASACFSCSTQVAASDSRSSDPEVGEAFAKLLAPPLPPPPPLEQFEGAGEEEGSPFFAAVVASVPKLEAVDVGVGAEEATSWRAPGGSTPCVVPATCVKLGACG